MKFKIKKRLIFFALVILLASVFVFSGSVGSDFNLKKESSVLSEHIVLDTQEDNPYLYGPSAVVYPLSDELLGKYETSDREFKRLEIGDLIVYWHQRMVDDAFVEKDQIVYQFDKDTKELVKEIVQWREDLPEHLPQLLITKEGAESMVEGEVQYSNLFYISPESVVFPIKPAPKNPCWVVTSIDNGNVIVTIIDAVEGKILDYGIPPPYTAFSLSGPSYSNPCSGSWDAWYLNAKSWFNAMGYSTEAVQWPTESKVKSHIQSTGTAMFYEVAHGDYTSFASGCSGGNNYEYTSAAEVETWIADYTKMPFTFIGSCNGMCEIVDGTLSYEFRKGSITGTATVGYCNMDGTSCSSFCWSNAVAWQSLLFDYMNQGYTVKSAFDKANAAYPNCANYNCMRFAGDTSFKVVPIVKRSGKFDIGDTVEVYNTGGVGLWVLGPDDACGPKIIVKPDGARGTVLQGPVYCYGYNRWKISWNDDGKIGWSAEDWLKKVVNNPPNIPSSVNQFRSNGITTIPEGGTTPESTVVFKGTVSDPDGDNVRLEIELRLTSESFIGEPTPETISDYVPSGSQVTITRYGLNNGNYKWQYRAKDTKGAVSAWKEFGTVGNTDFIVNAKKQPGELCNLGSECSSGYCEGALPTYPKRCCKTNPPIDGWYGGGDSGVCTWNDPTSYYYDYYCDETGEDWPTIKDMKDCDDQDGWYNYGDNGPGCNDMNDPTAQQRDYFVITNTNQCDYGVCTTKDCDSQDGWYGGGNNAGCGDDPASQQRDYYVNSAGSCVFTTTNCGTKDCDSQDDCTTHCNGNKVEGELDYYVILNTNTCTSIGGGIVEDCTTKTSADTDGGNKPLIFGKLTDYNSCLNGKCIGLDYDDVCQSTTNLLEYFPSATSYSTQNWLCASFEIAASDPDGNDPSKTTNCTAGTGAGCSSGQFNTQSSSGGTDKCQGTCGTGTNSCKFLEYYPADSSDACPGFDTCTTQNYDADTHLNTCNTCKGANYWNIGGDVPNCCGDDNNEYKKTRVCKLGACNSDTNDDACCNANSKCVYNSVCYENGYKGDPDNDSKKELCENGIWKIDFPKIYLPTNKSDAVNISF